MTTALILVGHGSHISAETAGIVWRQVDRLRALGVADEVTAAFWREMPSFYTVLNSISAMDITVVPLFTAQGYFTQTVIPVEMGTGFRYTRTLSEHPDLARIVRQRVDEAFAALGSTPEQTAIAVIGHSTRRHAESRKATEAQVARLREAGIAAQVEAVYLDDTPAIPDIYALTSTPTLIAVPFFLAAGSHTTLDVPQALGLPAGEGRAILNGREVYYTPPVGDDETLTGIILDLARDAGAPLNFENLPSNFNAISDIDRMTPPLYEVERGKGGEVWHSFPTVGRDALIQAVREKGELRFGQLRLTQGEVRVWGDDNAEQHITTPAALRAVVREQPFRPLATSADLPMGWCVEVSDDTMLHAVVETVYPGAVADWAAAQRGTFASTPLAATLARQTGIFRALAPMSDDEQAAWVTRICGDCVRHPTWHERNSPPLYEVERGTGGEVIPCAEACNVWLSTVLEGQS